MKADPREVLTVDLPEWRIVDDAIWFAIQERFTARGPCLRTDRPSSSTRSPASPSATPAAARSAPRACAPPVEGALIDHLQRHVLSEGVLQVVLDQIRAEIAAQLPQREADVSVLEAELRTAGAEQKRLAKAVALADEVPKLVFELKQRTQRITHSDSQAPSPAGSGVVNWKLWSALAASCR